VCVQEPCIYLLSPPSVVIGNSTNLIIQNLKFNPISGETVPLMSVLFKNSHALFYIASMEGSVCFTGQVPRTNGAKSCVWAKKLCKITDKWCFCHSYISLLKIKQGLLFYGRGSIALLVYTCTKQIFFLQLVVLTYAQ
jgi:hypothetical protein